MSKRDELVAKLRTYSWTDMHDAADLIERLRKENNTLRRKLRSAASPKSDEEKGDRSTCQFWEGCTYGWPCIHCDEWEPETSGKGDNGNE